MYTRFDLKLLTILCLIMVSCFGNVYAEAWKEIPAKAPEAEIVPVPQHAYWTGDQVALPEDVSIEVCKSFDIVGKRSRELLIRDLKHYGLTDVTSNEHADPLKESSGEFNIVVTTKSASPGILEKLDIASESDQEVKACLSKPDGYLLSVTPEGITICGSDERGALYGVQSLRQLMWIDQDGQIRVPAGRVYDWPEMGWRGYWMTPTLKGKGLLMGKRVLDTLSLLKYNVVIARVEHLLKYERRPALSGRSAVDKKTYKEFVDYGKSLGLEMIPSSAIYTHWDWVFWAKKYLYLKNAPGKKVNNFSTPNVAHPDYYELVRDIFLDTIDVFEPNYFHVGMDELCFASKPKESLNRLPFKEQYQRALNNGYKLCKEFDMTMIMWPDQLVRTWHGGPPMNTHDLASKVPEDVIFGYYSYFADTPDEFLDAVDQWVANGRKVLMTGWYDLHCIQAHTDKIRQLDYKPLGFVDCTWGSHKSLARIPEIAAAAVFSGEQAWSPNKPPLKRMKLFPPNVFYRLYRLGRQPLVNEYSALDISQTPAGTFADYKREGLFGRDRKYHLSNIPEGVLVDYCMAFNIPQYARRNKFVVLGSKNDKSMPHELTDITVDAKAQAIAFAHITDVPKRRALSFTNLDNRRRYDPDDVARYVVHYADGTKEEVEIRYFREITDWNAPGGASRAPVIWRGKTPGGAMAILVGYRWNNPHPDKVIERIDLIGGLSRLRMAVFGISLLR